MDVHCSDLFLQGYNRKATALFRLGQLDEAKAACEAGLGVDPNNGPLKATLESVNKGSTLT